jgi:uncharacterized protein (TIGR04255 family)
MIASAGEISRITGCMLRYTDLIPVVDGKTLPGTEAIAHLLSTRFNCSFDTTQNGIVLISTKFSNIAGSVSSIRNRPGKPGWTLIFTMNTQGPPGFDSSDDILNWFDNARSAIHELFDLIVPEEIVETFR